MCAASPLQSLKASSDFQRISRLGKKCSFPAFIMQVLRHEGEAKPFRLGLTVSRKVGNAVVRNRAKRRLREMVRTSVALEKLAGFDIVLIGRASARERDFSLMKQDFLSGLEKLGVSL
jgi:ribonuclease P protein component